MVNDHSDTERKPAAATIIMGCTFRVTARDMNHPTDSTAHSTAFVMPVVEHLLEREIAQWVHHQESMRRLIVPWADPIRLLLFRVHRGIEVMLLELYFYYWHEKSLKHNPYISYLFAPTCVGCPCVIKYTSICIKCVIAQYPNPIPVI